MKATPLDQERLLELQKIDTQILQAEHRRKSLPELAEITRLSEEIAELSHQRDELGVAISKESWRKPKKMSSKFGCERRKMNRD